MTSPNEKTSILEDKDIFPDLPLGPLTIYRKRASFDYKKLALILEPEDSHRLKIPAYHVDKLLLILRNIAPGLPKCCKTLCKTPRIAAIVEMDNGQYLDVGLRNCLNRFLSNNNFDGECITIDINTDGVSASKSSSSDIWPILVSVVGYEEILMPGAFHGTKKPSNVNHFLKRFVDEYNELSGGFCYGEKTYNLHIRALVADIPARTFILDSIGHTGYSSCTKCTIRGERTLNTISFPGFDFEFRTDTSVRNRDDEHHHHSMEPTIAESLPINLVDDVVVDNMHCTYLGVQKLLLTLWIIDRREHHSMTAANIRKLSADILSISRQLPNEFSRFPRSLNYLKRYKATEFRQLLLYTLPVLLEGKISKHKIWAFMENHPEFSRSTATQSLNEMRQSSTRLHNIMNAQNFWTPIDFLQKPHLDITYYQSLVAYGDFYVKAALGCAMFSFVLQANGTERLQKYVDACNRMEILGSFALTEVAHGTNTLGMRTTAIYDAKAEEFIINTPDFQAAKAWIGNLGKTCTHSIVFAQLYTPDGEHHGLNSFLVPIRSTKTLRPFTGVLVGDLGEKVGLNGLDNGFIMFDNYRIPRENLLSRYGDVTHEGKFVTKIKDQRKRMAASFGGLSGGRVNICGTSTMYLIQAVTIAVRYSASRKQFGPETSSEEYSVLEYQSQQYRILPHLAMAIVFKVFTHWLALTMNQTIIKQIMGEHNLNSIRLEIHVLSSAAKPYCTWAIQKAIQDCRESCGGHGYLKVAGFGELRNNNDASCTYEGENNVLIQQTSNWLLNVRKNGYQSFKDVSPLGSAEFLKDFHSIINSKFNFKNSEEALRPENIQIALNWMCAWLLEETGRRWENLKSAGKSSFETRNEIQIYYAKTLSILFAQRTIFSVFHAHILKLENTNGNANELSVLNRILSLYGGNLLIEYLGMLYEGGFISESTSAVVYKEGILNLLSVFKNDAIALVDSIAPTDFIIDSPLGKSDGEIYRHLKSTLMQSPEVFQRPYWWNDMVHWSSYAKAKL